MNNSNSKNTQDEVKETDNLPTDKNNTSLKNEDKDEFDNYLKNGNVSEKTLQSLTQISKQLSTDFDLTQSPFDEYNSSDSEKDENDTSDFDYFIEKNDSEDEKSNLEESIAEKQKPKKSLYFKSTIYTFLFVFCLTFISFTYIFNYVLIPIQVVGVSMQPTINLSVDDNGYYEGNLDKEHCDIVYYNKDKSYKNNDIVIIKNNGYIDNSLTDKPSYEANNEESSGSVEYLIKRVVAKEFQTIKFIRKNYDATKRIITYTVTVTDKDGKSVELDKSFEKNGEEMLFYDGMPEMEEQFFPFFTEIFSAVENDGEYSYVVPENHYFVMGDNRNNSTDSRFFGTVKYEDIEGEVKLMVPYSKNLIQAIFAKLKSYI